MRVSLPPAKWLSSLNFSRLKLGSRHVPVPVAVPIWSLPAGGRNDQSREHLDDALEKHSRGLHTVKIAELASLARVKRGRALGTRSQRDPIEARLFGRSELACAFSDVVDDRS